MFILLCLVSCLSFCFASADDNAPTVGGHISSFGVSFANQASMQEALERGHFDGRNPFVTNVGCIRYSTQDGGMDSATITRVAPDVYLMCKHTFAGFQKSHQALGAGMILTLMFDDVLLTQATGMVAVPHPDQDFALVKMTFGQQEGEFPSLPFLPILSKLITGQNTAFVTSCAEAHYATSMGSVRYGAERDQHRVLSVHAVDMKTPHISSAVKGILHTSELKAEALSALAFSPDPNVMAANLKAVTRKGLFFLGGDHRLASTCSYGASGSPLVIRVDGKFVLAGLLVQGATRPIIITRGAGVIAITESKVGNLVHDHIFLNLQPYAEWLGKALARLA